MESKIPGISLWASLEAIILLVTARSESSKNYVFIPVGLGVDNYREKY